MVIGVEFLVSDEDILGAGYRPSTCHRAKYPLPSLKATHVEKGYSVKLDLCCVGPQRREHLEHWEVDTSSLLAGFHDKSRDLLL